MAANFNPARSALLALALTLAWATPQALAQTYIWDTSTDAGYQNANGTWGSDNFWTTNTGANSGTVLSGWTSGATAWFGGNATVAATPGGNVTTTVDGTQTAASVRQIANGAGDFTLTGGTLVLGAGGVRADRGTFTVDSVITNSAATLQLNVQSATGLIVLGGDNTYTATSEIRGLAGGTVRLNHAGALGTGSSVQFVNSSVLLDLNGFDVSGKTITVNANQTGFLGNTAATKSIWSGNVNLANATGSLRAGGTNAEVEISGTISGIGTLQSFDSGVLRLSGDNTYSGGTSVRAGSTLIIGHSNALGSVSHTNFIGSGTLDLNGFDIGSRTIRFQQNNSRMVNDNTSIAAFHSGTIEMQDNRDNSQVGGDGNLTLSGNIAVVTGDFTGGGLTKVGTGTLTLSGSNTYTGTTTLSAGTLRVGSDNALGTGGLTIGSGTVLASADANARIIANAITMGGNAQFGDATGTGNLTLSNINLGTATRTFTVNNNTTVAGAITNTGGLTKAGAGTLTLTALNSYSGGTFLNGGWLVAGHTNAFGTGSITVGSGTTLNLTNFNIANLVVNNGGTILSTGTLADVIATNGTTDIGGSNSTIEEIGGTAVVNVTGSGVVVSNATGGTVNLGGGSAVVIAASGGTVNANASGATLGTVSGTAAVNVAGTDARVATLSGGSVAANASGLVVTNFNGGNIAVSNGVTVGLRSGSSSGVISGQGGIAKQGAETLTLAGVNTLSGATTVEQGKLVVNGSLNNSAVTVQSGATLGGSGSIGTLTLNGILAPGNSAGQTDAGATAWNQGGSYDWEIFSLVDAPGSSWDWLNITNGSLDLSGITAPGGFTINLITLATDNSTPGPLDGFNAATNYSNWLIASAPTINGFNANLFTLNTNSFVGATGTFAIEQRAAGADQGLFITYTGGGEPIPEPGTWAAAALLALGAACVARRRKRVTFARLPSADKTTGEKQ